MTKRIELSNNEILVISQALEHNTMRLLKLGVSNLSELNRLHELGCTVSNILEKLGEASNE